MKKITLATLIFAAFAGSAQAETFEFSYTFGMFPQRVTGSFEGNRSGDLVTDLSNFHLSFDGTSLVGPLYGWSRPETGGFIKNGSVASFSGKLNNFLISDTDVLDASSSYFYSINYVIMGTQYTQYLKSVQGVSRSDYGTTNSTNFSWALTPVSSVPEPETYALMLAGLGLVGAVARRRTSKQA